MRNPFAIALALAAMELGGCDGGSTGGGQPALQPMPSTLTGVYSGRLPCSNCTAVMAMLWLRDDGRFVLRQTPTDEPDGPKGTPSYALGRWHWDGRRAQAVLTSVGPERRLIPMDTDRLRLLTVSTVEQTLSRTTDTPSFTDRLRLEGESAVTESGATFTECLTGLKLPVARTSAYRELRRQHRVLNPRGKVALTVIEGHLDDGRTSDDGTETLIVDRVITLRPGTPCRAAPQH